MNQLVFMPRVGIPDGTVNNAAIPDYESVLTHPRMVEQVDPTDPTRLLTVCQAPGYGKAYPREAYCPSSSEPRRNRGNDTTRFDL